MNKQMLVKSEIGACKQTMDQPTRSPGRKSATSSSDVHDSGPTEPEWGGVAGLARGGEVVMSWQRRLGFIRWGSRQCVHGLRRTRRSRTPRLRDVPAHRNRKRRRPSAPASGFVTTLAWGSWRWPNDAKRRDLVAMSRSGNVAGARSARGAAAEPPDGSRIPAWRR